MKLGVSNRFFYYTGTGNATFDQRYTITLKDSIDFDAMKYAINETLKYYPEFRQKIIVKDGKFDAVINDKPPVVFEDEGNHKYISDEVNNYPYFFTYSKERNDLILNAFHGFTDGLSIIKFYTSLLYHYACRLGDKFTDTELCEIKKIIRTTEDDLALLDEEIQYDPYLKFHDANAKPAYQYTCDDAYYFNNKQYDESANYVHLYELTLSTSEFVKKSKEIGTSFAPLLIYAISKGISKNFTMDKRPVVAMLPLDCRRIFDVDTMVNFADGISIPFFSDDIVKDSFSVCSGLKDYMIKQQTKENMSLVMESKVNKVSTFENGDKPLYDILRDNQKMLPIDAKRPTTYAMSYSGKVDFTEHLNKYVTNFKIYAYVRAYSTVVCTYGDKLNVMIAQRTDEDKFPCSVKSGFDELGLKSTLVDRGKLYANVIDIDDIKGI